MQMQDLASFISIAAVVVFSLGLAVALILALDGVFRWRSSMGLKLSSSRLRLSRW
jgi:hypothetical protein